MNQPVHSFRDALTTMADGTIKQINPFSGTEVWTIPGRAQRPLSVPPRTPRPLDPGEEKCACSFCQDNLLRTPPEKSRIVRNGASWEILRGLLPHQLGDTTPEFRRVPNLFEIVSFDYWRKNYGYAMNDSQRERMETYLADPTGREHVGDIVRTRLKASGKEPNGELSGEDIANFAPSYFAGGHDVIIGRRHFIDGAVDDSQLASSGSLTPEEHYAFIALTIDAMRDLYDNNRYAPYVAVFQNWLAPAGASFDHLHKQLVAIDERGVQTEMEISKLRRNANLYNEWAVNYAFYNNLVIAENDHAIMLAGIGHRFPSLCVYSKAAATEPWDLSSEEMRDFSDMLHAAHAATGADVASNEEWHYKPIDLDLPMPLRVNVKWRVSTLAGFEGGTKIYVNTLSPTDIRDRTVSRLYALRDASAVAGSIRIATECAPSRNCLRYNPALG
ncbi:hypothetical protein CAPI_04315 [Corynebacterium capitovis DSM 44611]|uniref:DUF4921 family protein n=1 Tax=Corynebacterium capitovis TaxID=131081 RepID=UPI0004771BA7|nr:DUF4921 family protein [Corynebacterium capitovis]WKD57421.1 hypothetical protein CAPI_04315 [Corynebacterium capitovis DSM 44611]